MLIKVCKIYGFMNWFVNMDKEYIVFVLEMVFVYIGVGINMVYVDLEYDLVIVVCWINCRLMSDFVGKVFVVIKE